MQAFRSNTAKIEPLCLPPPPPPPPLPRPSFMPPPPPPLSLSLSAKRFESPGSSPVIPPVQNRFSKPPEQRHFQRPQHLPFLLPPPPPKIGSQAHRRRSSPPSAQYRTESQSSSLQRRNRDGRDESSSLQLRNREGRDESSSLLLRNREGRDESNSLLLRNREVRDESSSLHLRIREGKDDNTTSVTIPVAKEELSRVKTPVVKEKAGRTHNVVTEKVEDKSCTSDEVCILDKTNRKRPSEKQLHTTDSSSSLPKELTQKFGPLKCDLCSVSVNSTVQAKMHYSGKQHEKKVHSFLLNWSKETGEPLPKQFKDGSPKKQSTLEKKQSTLDVSFCELCNIALTSSAHAAQHYMGRNHRRALEGRATANAKVERCIVPPPDPTGRFGIGSQFQPWTNTDPLGLKSPEPDSPSLKTNKFFCELCKVAATSKDQLDMHLRGAKHRKAETANKQRSSVTSTTPQATQSDSILASVMQNEDGTQNAVRKDYSIYRTPSGYYYCQPCNLTLNSEAQFIQHCESKKHKVKTATAKKPVSKPLKPGNVA